MTLIVGFDPSTNSAGVAIMWRGAIVGAERVVFSKETKAIRERGGRVDACACEIINVIQRWRNSKASSEIAIDTFVYEWVQIYGVGKAPGNPNDLPALVAIGAAVVRHFSPLTILTPTPREWQGGTSKTKKGDPWDCTRGAKLKSRLSAAELAVIPSQHDALDAVGLALHATPRALAKAIKKYSRGSNG